VFSGDHLNPVANGFLKQSPDKSVKTRKLAISYILALRLFVY
jgi:hypothetical protein